MTMPVTDELLLVTVPGAVEEYDWNKEWGILVEVDGKDFGFRD